MAVLFIHIFRNVGDLTGSADRRGLCSFRQVVVVAAMFGRAVGMVAQNLDHPAIGDPPSGAMIDHALQLSLQRKQARDAPFDRLKLGARDGIHFGAGLVWPV